ncbi:hypothetical protein KTD13_01855 [Burkholderia multivorans]|uniref:hypothetical protein n=1 Tax=Burkholderia multivorans TaxID=87883 RepID=UPI001C2317FC|nr:hypothetical protein [Burkholderia multivorans]MBU9259091.1 hypothetical protein [Burkholderia multivorans]
MAIKNWLKASYETHGNSTSKASKPTRNNTFDTPTAQIKRTTDKNTDMDKTTRQGNSSGGGRSSISKGVPTDSKAAKNKNAAGLMSHSPVKPHQKRGSY